MPSRDEMRAQFRLILSLVFHSLRKSFLTACDGAQASPRSTQALARHATPDLTFRRYVGAVDSELVRVVEAVGAVVRGVGQSTGQSTIGS
jgi:integrase